MHLIVGLGNPGNEYAGNRHNIGAMAVDEIARCHGFPAFKTKFQGLIADGRIGSERVLLLKPQTYMNRSGDSVLEAAKFYKIPVDEITVIYDELDLAPGKVRVKMGGGTGGHNGLRSIDPQVGNNYQRIRLGIGHPGAKELVNRHVLSDFAKAEQQGWLETLLRALADNAEMIATKDSSGLMNKIALALSGGQQPAPKTAKKTEQAKDQTTGSSPATKADAPSARSDNKSDGPMADMLKKFFSKD